jgi:hypothetical protein
MCWLRLEHLARNSHECLSLVNQKTLHPVYKQYFDHFLVFDIFFRTVVSQCLSIDEVKSIFTQHLHLLQLIIATIEGE